LEGGISFLYDSEVILNKEMETTDLLFTWQSLAEPLLFPDEREYRVELLDSLYEIRIEASDAGLVFHRKELGSDREGIQADSRGGV